MGLVDQAIYVAILAQLGPVALAVTTSLHIDFLRKPSPTADVIARCDLLKLGKRLAVGAVVLHSEGLDEPIAHASATYSLPPQSRS